MSVKQTLYSTIPSVDSILQHPSVARLCQDYPVKIVHNVVRSVLDETRQSISTEKITSLSEFPTQDNLIEQIVLAVKNKFTNHLKRAINGAGVILHTGLGRAPLAPSAQQALREAAERYCILASERETGKRGDRNRHTAEMLRELTGAEDSLIVNNNAAAVILALNTFGLGKQSIVSRGELVEIGGAFRVPDVMRRSGTTMVEVGTTNKTHLRDYAEAITDESGILLKVHTSNYRIEGFHKEVSISELKTLSTERNLIIIHDIGSGAMVDLSRWGLESEPTVPDAVADGADIVTFSGDKLLGGPQCGIIVGKKELIDKLKKNPLMRVFRCDKLIISALDGTLKLFLDPDKLPETHPIYEMIAASVDKVNRRAQRIARTIRSKMGEKVMLDIIDGSTEMGSGALPARSIPSRVISIVIEGLSAVKLGRMLRLSEPPLFTRIENDKVIIDARTVADSEVQIIGKSFERIIGL